MAKKVIIENIYLGQKGDEFTEDSNKNYNNLNKAIDNLDGEAVKKASVTTRLGFSQERVPSEYAVSLEASRLQKEIDSKPSKEDVALGLINKGSVDKIADLPNNATKGDAYFVKETGFIHQFDGTKWNQTIYTAFPKNINEKIDKDYSYKEDISFLNPDNTFVHLNTSEVIAGNNIINSVRRNVSGIKRINYTTEIKSSTNAVAVLTFLDNTKKVISFVQKFDIDKTVSDFADVPSNAVEVVIAFRVGYTIEVQFLSGELINNTTKLGYTNTINVDFSISDNNYMNRTTGQREVGNNKLRSVTKSLEGIDFVRYKAEIINSTNNVALLTFLDENDNVILFSKPFIEDSFVQGEIGTPQNAKKVVIAFRVGKSIEVQLLAGEIVDDTVRESKFKVEIEQISNTSIKKDFSNITPVSFAETDDRFTDYLTGEVKAGNNLIRSVTKSMEGVKKVQYDTELVNSSNFASAIMFFDDYHNIISYHLPLKKDEKVKGEIEVPANAITAEFTYRVGKHIFINLVSDVLEDTTIKKDFEVLKNVSFETPDNFFIHYQNSNVVQGNNLINSVTEKITDDIKFIRYTTDLVISQSAVAVVTFLDTENKVVYYEQKWDSTKRVSNIINIPPNAVKVVFAFRVGQYISVQLLGNTLVDNVARKHEVEEIARKINNAYSIARTLYDAPKIGESKVGNFRLECNVKEPQAYKRLTHNNISYTDVNKCRKQFDLINGNPKILQDGLLNKLRGEVIDFTPDNNGFVRIVIGKDSKDRFYIAYTPSYRIGAVGDAKESKLEVTTDFVTFETIWRGQTSTDTNGLSIANYININPMQVKELGNGNLLVGSGYTRSDLPSNDGIATGANTYSGYFIISEDFSSIKLCDYTDLEGNTKPMNSTHHVMEGSTSYSNQQFYDWSIFIYNNIVLATEYGDREDAGIVWYSENNGETFKQIFWMPTHYQDGVTNGDNISYTHIHGVMYDFYRNRIYIIAGEANSNLFWSDKGLDTTNNDWNVESIRRQTRYPHLSYMQVVNGYPFRDCLVYGSDFTNMGAFMRVNREREGVPQQIEVAHEILPQIYSGTLYCAGGITQRDQNSPVLMCMTRENAMSTPEQQTEHLKQHLSRIVATYDGFNFFEIWLDDTFGVYEVFNRKSWKIENREFAKCTRDMTAWLCRNGDLIIKYSGRDFLYMTSDYSETLFGNFPSQIVRYKNVDRLL